MVWLQLVASTMGYLAAASIAAFSVTNYQTNEVTVHMLYLQAPTTESSGRQSSLKWPQRSVLKLRNLFFLAKISINFRFERMPLTPLVLFFHPTTLCP